MMWDYSGMNGGNWLWMAPMMVLLWGAVIALVVFAVLAIKGRPSEGQQAIVTLKQRLASGQINQDEYEKTLRLLEG